MEGDGSETESKRQENVCHCRGGCYGMQTKPKENVKNSYIFLNFLPGITDITVTTGFHNVGEM